MLSKAPRTLLVLLALIFIGRLVFAFLQPGPIIFSLLQLALFVIFSWQALDGKESAAKALGAFQLLGGAITLYQLAPLIQHPLAIAILLPWALLLIGTGIYIFMADDLKKFYATTAFQSPYAR